MITIAANVFCVIVFMMLSTVLVISYFRIRSILSEIDPCLTVFSIFRYNLVENIVYRLKNEKEDSIAAFLILQNQLNYSEALSQSRMNVSQILTANIRREVRKILGTLQVARGNIQIISKTNRIEDVIPLDLNIALSIHNYILNMLVEKSNDPSFYAMEEAIVSIMKILHDSSIFIDMQNSSFRLERYEFNLAQNIDAIVDSYKRTAEKKGVPLIYSSNLSSSQWHYGDGSKLNQVFSTMIRHALDCTSDGFIKIVCNVTQDETDVTFQCSVEDSGPSVKNRQLTSVFDLEGLARASQDKPLMALGYLELFICSEICKAMGGLLTQMSSHKGGGLINDFCVVLRKSKHIEVADPLPRRAILIVDDEPSLRRTYERLFKKLGYDCVAVSSGEEAVEALTKRSFDLIFMDLVMPEMDGIETTKMICRRFPELLRRTVIVGLSSSENEVDIENFRNAGMSHYINKLNFQAEIRPWLNTFKFTS